MNDMFLSANRPFFQSSIIMTLGPIAADAYRAFANDKLSRQRRSIDASTFAYVYGEISCGVTWHGMCRFSFMASMSISTGR